MLVLLIAVIIIAFAIDYVTKRLLWRFSAGIAKRTKTDFDNILIDNKLPRNVAHVVPLIILIEFLPQIFSDFQYAESIISKTLKVVGIILTLSIIRSIF